MLINFISVAMVARHFVFHKANLEEYVDRVFDRNLSRCTGSYPKLRTNWFSISKIACCKRLSPYSTVLLHKKDIFVRKLHWASVLWMKLRTDRLISCILFLLVDSCKIDLSKPRLLYNSIFTSFLLKAQRSMHVCNHQRSPRSFHTADIHGDQPQR